MRPLKEQEHAQTYLILAATLTILAAAALLTIFLTSKPPTSREVQLGKELERKIAGLPKESELKSSIASEISRVRSLYGELYGRCVKNENYLAAGLTDCIKSIDQLTSQMQAKF